MLTVTSRGFLVGCCLLACLLSACASSGVPPLPAASPKSEGEVSQDYMLGPEDSVEVQVWKNPELSRTVIVRPDGKISLPLVGDVQAAGQTPAQLTDAVAEKLKIYYREPAQVTVIVHQVNSYAIYVLGEVHQQGKHLVRSGTTFLQVISLVGGFTTFASRNKITLRRKDHNGTEVTTIISYKDVLAGQQPNVALKAGDILIVP